MKKCLSCGKNSKAENKIFLSPKSHLSSRKNSNFSEYFFNHRGSIIDCPRHIVSVLWPYVASVGTVSTEAFLYNCPWLKLGLNWISGFMLGDRARQSPFMEWNGAELWRRRIHLKCPTSASDSNCNEFHAVCSDKMFIFGTKIQISKNPFLVHLWVKIWIFGMANHRKSLIRVTCFLQIRVGQI